MKKFITFLLMAVFMSSTGLVNVEAKTRKAKNTRSVKIEADLVGAFSNSPQTFTTFKLKGNTGTIDHFYVIANQNKRETWQVKVTKRTNNYMECDVYYCKSKQGTMKGSIELWNNKHIISYMGVYHVWNGSTIDFNLHYEDE